MPEPQSASDRARPEPWMTWTCDLRSQLRLALLERPRVDCEELRREFAKALRPLFEQDGQAEKKMADAFESACRLCVAWRVIPLRIAQEPMAVAADCDQFVIVSAAGDVMKLQRQRVIEPADCTTRRYSYPIVRMPVACDARGSVRDRSWSNSFK